MSIHHTPRLLFVVLSAGFFSHSAPQASSAVLLAGWDFQSAPGTVISQPPGTPRDFTANAGIFQTTSHLYLDGTHGSSAFLVDTGTPGNVATELGALNGITANTAGTTLSTAGTVGSMALFDRGLLNGKSMVFQVSMAGYEFLTFSLGAQRPAAAAGTDNYGVSLLTMSYSTDGLTFSPWGVIDTGAGQAVSNTAFALSPGLSAVDNVSQVFVRMTVSGATGSNSTRFDNFQFNATPVPEPGACAMLTVSGLCLAARRRLRRGQSPSLPL
ncbi:MAG: hypothetical protein V4726_00040 [Verrucomicrobiota bacterium]